MLSVLKYQIETNVCFHGDLMEAVLTHDAVKISNANYKCILKVQANLRGIKVTFAGWPLNNPPLTKPKRRNIFNSYSRYMIPDRNKTLACSMYYRFECSANT